MNAIVFSELREELDAASELDDRSPEELDSDSELEDPPSEELDSNRELDDRAELEDSIELEEESSSEDSELSALAKESDKNAAPKTKTPNRILISLN